MRLSSSGILNVETLFGMRVRSWTGVLIIPLGSRCPLKHDARTKAHDVTVRFSEELHLYCFNFTINRLSEALISP